MKKFATIAFAVLLPAAAWADTISSPGAGIVGVPATFLSSTGSGGAPFWNNNSMDGLNMNAGYFLTGSNANLGSTNYLGSNAGYLSTGGSGLDAPTNFSFLQGGLTIDSTLLYSNAGANMTSAYGTQIGIYDVNDPSHKQVLFAHGTLYNLAAGSNGVYNNNIDPQGTSTINTFANYGFFAQTCGYKPTGGIYCDTYYSNAALNPEAESAHQHFALFENPLDNQTFYIAYEDARGISPTEGYGDYNDVIFRLVTDDAPETTVTVTETNPVPEPATFSIIGLGLVGLGLMRRSRLKK